MPATPIKLGYTEGQTTLTIKLFDAPGDTTELEEVTMTESARVGTYDGTVSNALTGVKEVDILIGGTKVADGTIDLKDDTNTYRVESAGSNTIARIDAAINAALAGVTSSDLADINAGDDLSGTDGTARAVLETYVGQWGDLAGATITFGADQDAGTATMTGTATLYTDADGRRAIRIEMTAAQTDVRGGVYSYNVQATLASGNVRTLAAGDVTVLDDHARWS